MAEIRIYFQSLLLKLKCVNCWFVCDKDTSDEGVEVAAIAWHSFRRASTSANKFFRSVV